MSEQGKKKAILKVAGKVAQKIIDVSRIYNTTDVRFYIILQEINAFYDIEKLNKLPADRFDDEGNLLPENALMKERMARFKLYMEGIISPREYYGCPPTLEPEKVDKPVLGYHYQAWSTDCCAFMPVTSIRKPVEHVVYHSLVELVAK